MAALILTHRNRQAAVRLLRNRVRITRKASTLSHNGRALRRRVGVGEANRPSRSSTARGRSSACALNAACARVRLGVLSGSESHGNLAIAGTNLVAGKSPAWVFRHRRGGALMPRRYATVLSRPKRSNEYSQISSMSRRALGVNSRRLITGGLRPSACLQENRQSRTVPARRSARLRRARLKGR